MAGANETPPTTTCLDPYGNDDTQRPQFQINAPVYDGNQQILAGYVSDLKLKLKTLENILKGLGTTANGTVRMEMPLSANLVVNSTESGKCPAVCAQQDVNVKNYKVVLTWGGDTNFDQQPCKCVFFHGILSGTQWKISEINQPPNGAKEGGEPGKDPTQQSAEGEQSKGKEKA